MRRMPIPVRPKPFLSLGCPREIYAGLASLSEGCPPDRGRLHTCYSPVRRSPASSASTAPAAPRLACVKPAASVHPEPGSNSPLLYIFFDIFLLCFVLSLSGCSQPICPDPSYRKPESYRGSRLASLPVSSKLAAYCPVAFFSMSFPSPLGRIASQVPAPRPSPVLRVQS